MSSLILIELRLLIIVILVSIIKVGYQALLYASIRCTFSIVKIERERYFKPTGKIENETSYYISTLNNANEIGQGIRKHWGIENKVHWVLDVAFSEDLSRKRTGNAAQNFSSLNRIALNLLKKDDAKVGIKSRRKMAGWGNEYLLKLIKS